MRGRTSAGNLIFRPSGLILRLTNSKAAAMAAAFALPMPSTLVMSCGEKSTPFSSMILMIFLERASTSSFCVPLPRITASSS